MGNNFKELIVWQKAMELAKEIYRLTRLLPKEELYALSSQMRRAAVSIPSNIAEGQARNSRREFISFLSIAKGSSAELQTQCLLCETLGYLQKGKTQQALILAEEVSRMLNSLIKSLSTEIKRQSTKN